jgi:hypothetical protein
MTKQEFDDLYCPGSCTGRDTFKRQLTELCDDAAKDAKIDGFKIALRLIEANPLTAPAILRSLITATPPVEE